MQIIPLDGGVGGDEVADIERQPVFVDFNYPHDPRLPLNWPLAKKVYVQVVLGLFILVGTITTSIMGPAQRMITAEFQVADEVAVLTTSLFMVGYIAGFLVFGPLSEKFGRKWPLITGMGVSSAFSAMPALGRDVATILAGRFLAGFFGVACMAVMGGIASDCFTLSHRGVAMPIVVAVVFLGPTFGAVVGSAVVALSPSWRWTSGVVAIAGSVLSAASCVALPETYPPAILRSEAARLQMDSRVLEVRSALDKEGFTLEHIARIYLIRPFWLLATQPILALLTLYQAFLHGVLFLFYQSYPYLFGTIRGWPQQLSALPLLGINVGVLVGTAGIILYNQLYFRHLHHVAAGVADGAYIPEARLPPMILGGALIPVGMFWYAWTSSPEISWASTACASPLIGCGMYLVFIQGFNYIVDCYTSMANSAMGINGSVRCSFAAAFPLFASQMFRELGVAYATTALGAISVCLVPVPVCFWYWGDRIRSWSRRRIVV